MRDFGRRFPLGLYLGAIGAIVAAITTGVLALGRISGSARWAIAAAAIPLVLAASQLAVTFVNWLVTMLIVPKPLPKLDFSRGVPETMRTLVAVPTMLVSERNVADLLEGLEVRYLANRDNHVHFALVTDFQDAQEESTPADAAILHRAKEGIEALNVKYKGDSGERFFLFHRPRRWNSHEGVWMGYEPQARQARRPEFAVTEQGR